MFLHEFYERCLFIIKGKNSFPFTKGEGLAKALEKLGYKAILDISQKKITLLTKNKVTYIPGGSQFFIQVRADNIRKKFKVSFHRNLSKIITGKKKNKAKKKSLFKLPQNFIRNVNILDNSLVMDLTYEELTLNIKKEK